MDTLIALGIVGAGSAYIYYYYIRKPKTDPDNSDETKMGDEDGEDVDEMVPPNLKEIEEEYIRSTMEHFPGKEYTDIEVAQQMKKDCDAGLPVACKLHLEYEAKAAKQLKDFRDMQNDFKFEHNPAFGGGTHPFGPKF